MSKHKAVPDPLPHALPPDAGGEDAIHAQHVRDKIQAGLDSLDHGSGIPHDAAQRRMARWLDDGSGRPGH